MVDDFKNLNISEEYVLEVIKNFINKELFISELSNNWLRIVSIECKNYGLVLRLEVHLFSHIFGKTIDCRYLCQ